MAVRKGIRNRYRNRIKLSAALSIAALAATQTAGTKLANAATQLQWNTNTSGTPVDGSGTWNTSTSNWYNGSSDVDWANGDAAVFGVNGSSNSNEYTITMGSSVTAAGLVFNAVTNEGLGTTAGLYTIIATAADSLTLSSGAYIDVYSYTGQDTFHFLSASIKGANGLVSSGSLSINGEGAYNGGVSPTNGGAIEIYNNNSGFTLSDSLSIINDGLLVLGNNDALGTAGASVSVQAGAGLYLGFTGATTANSIISNPITIAGDGWVNDVAGANTVPNGALRINHGIDVSGNLTLNANAAVYGNGSSTSPNEISGTITEGANTLTLAGSYTILAGNVGSTAWGSGGGLIVDTGTHSTGFLIAAVANALGQGTLTLGSAAGGWFDGTFGTSGEIALDSNNETVTELISASASSIISNNSASNGTATLTFGDSTNQTFAGVLTDNSASFSQSNYTTNGALAIVKTGSGTELFSNANNNYSGGTTIQNGTLQLGATGALPNASSITFGDSNNHGGTLDLNGFNATVTSLATVGNGTQTITDSSTTAGTLTYAGGTGSSSFSGNLTGSNLALTVSSGTLTLSGAANTFGGATADNGVLDVTGSITASTVTVGGSATMDVTGTAASVIVNGGTLEGPGGNLQGVTLNSGTLRAHDANTSIATLTMTSLTTSGGNLLFNIGNSSAVDVLAINGTAMLGSGTTLTLNLLSGDSPTQGENVPILASTGLTNDIFSGVGSTTVIGRATLTPYVGGSTPAGDANAGTNTNDIYLYVSGGPAILYWNDSSGNGYWDENTSKNWDDVTYGENPDVFITYDNVNFDDAHNGGHYNVNVDTTVDPGSINVNNSSGNYVISGSGTIGGATSLVKEGADNLTLSTSDTYSGGTTIGNGTLVIGNNNAIPTGSSVSLGDGTNNGTLDLKGFNATLGGLSNSNVGMQTVTDSGAASTLTFAPLNTSAASVYSGTVSGANLSLTVNDGSLTLSGTETYGGSTTIIGGTLGIAGTDNNTGGITINSSGTLSVAGSIGGSINNSGSLNATNPTASVTDLNGTGFVVLSAADTLTVSPTAADTVSGVISGSGALTIGGTGTSSLTLTAANSYIGTTTINTGATLQIGNFSNTTAQPGNASNSAAASPITVNGSLIVELNSIYSADVETGIPWFNNLSGTGSITLVANSSGGTAVKFNGNNSAFNGTITIQGDINDEYGAQFEVDTPTLVAGASTSNSPGSSADIIVQNGGALLWDSGQNFAGNISLAGVGNASDSYGGTYGALRVDGGGAATFSGNITLVGTSGATVEIYNGSETVTISGPITDNGVGIQLQKAGSATLVLSNAANSWSGGTAITNGRLQLHASGALPVGIVTFGTDTELAGIAPPTSGQLDLDGTNQTVSGLVVAAAGSSPNTIFNDSTATASTLTYAQGTNPASTFSGSVSGVASTTPTTLNLNITSGSLDLTGATTYSGTTTIAGGASLQVAGANTETLSGAITGGGNLTLGDGSNNTDITLSNTSNNLTGSLTINNPSTAVVKIAGAFGPTSLSNGQLGIAEAAPGGVLTLNSLTTTGGNLLFTVGNGSTADTISVTNTASLSANTTIRLTGLGGATGGENTPILTAGTLDNSIAAAGNGTLATTTAGRQTLYAYQGGATLTGLSDSDEGTDTNYIYLYVSGSAASLQWTGTSTNWDVETTSDWWNTDTSALDYFYQNDNVTFGDTYDGSTAVSDYTVTLNTTVNPGSISVNNSAGNYVISGTGAIGGVTGLTKSGTGSLTLSTVNTYSGATMINSGSIVVTNSNSLGSTTGGAVTINAGGTLDLTGVASNALNFGAKTFDIAGTGATGDAGAIQNNGNEQESAFENITLIGNATIGGTGRIDIGRVGTGALNLGSYTLTDAITTDFGFDSYAVVEGNGGNIVVTAGDMTIQAAEVISAANDPGGVIVYDGSSTTPAIAGFYHTTGTITIPMYFNGAYNALKQDDNNANSLIGSNMYLNNLVTVNPDGSGTAAGSLTLTGNISDVTTAITVGSVNVGTGAGSILVNPSGTSGGILTLSGTGNTYSGGTTVDATGTLVGGAANAFGVGSLTTNGGTAQLGGFNQSVAGVLGTSGSVTNTSSTAATLTTNGTGAYTYSGTIANGTGGGSLSLTQNGAGTQVLGGTNTYTGATTVSAGILDVTGSLTASTTTVSGGTLTGPGGHVQSVFLTSGTLTAHDANNSIGTLTMTSLTTSSGGTLLFNVGNGSSADTLVVTNSGSGAATLANGTIISLNGVGTPTLGDNIPILIADILNNSMSAAANGTLASATIAGETVYAYQGDATLGFTDSTEGTDTNDIYLYVTSSATQAPGDTLYWTGVQASNNWDINSTANWNDTTASINPAVYQDTDAVNLDDTTNGQVGGTAVSTYNVTLNTTVNPGSVTVNNNAGNYVISGTGGIGGTTALTKLGADSLTLNTANTYTGATTISAGTLALGASGSIADSATISVANGATFDVSAVSGYTLGGSATQTLTGAGNVTGNVTVGASGTLAPGVASPATLSTLTVSGAVTLNSGGAFNVQVTPTTNVNDQLNAGTNAVTLGGTETITATSSLGSSPASYTVIQGHVYGNFASTMLPTAGTGLSWNTPLSINESVTGASTTYQTNYTYSEATTGTQGYISKTGNQYTGLTATENGGRNTTVTFLGGTVSTPTSLSVQFQSAPAGNAQYPLLSDVAAINGTNSDAYVLQMSYSIAPQAGSALSPVLAAYNPSTTTADGQSLITDTFVSAVLLNTSGTPVEYNGAYAGQDVVGDYGINTSNDTVWAVLNYSDDDFVVLERADGDWAGAGSVNAADLDDVVRGLGGSTLDPNGNPVWSKYAFDSSTSVDAADLDDTVRGLGAQEAAGEAAGVGGGLVFSGSSTPSEVPEPGSLVLLALGAIGITLRNRKKKGLKTEH